MIRCKCCGAETAILGAVDANRSCEDRPGEPVFPPSGRMVVYRRCGRCGFVFTADFDAWTDREMAEAIYNADYVRADPDFAEARPRFFATHLAAALAPLRDQIEALDYGGGQGLMARLLREQEFRFDSYDPYFGAEPLRPGRYDLVTAIEVVEHSRDPLGTFRQAVSALRPGGVLLFSTMLCPPDVTPGWSYIAPRNGHVSLHTRASLRACAAACGMRALSVSEGFHFFLSRKDSVLARHLVRHAAKGGLYTASLRGLGEFARVAMAVIQAGDRLQPLRPRHWVRALLHTGRPGARIGAAAQVGARAAGSPSGRRTRSSA